MLFFAGSNSSGFQVVWLYSEFTQNIQWDIFDGEKRNIKKVSHLFKNYNVPRFSILYFNFLSPTVCFMLETCGSRGEETIIELDLHGALWFSFLSSFCLRKTYTQTFMEMLYLPSREALRKVILLTVFVRLCLSVVLKELLFLILVHFLLWEIGLRYGINVVHFRVIMLQSFLIFLHTTMVPCIQSPLFSCGRLH